MPPALGGDGRRAWRRAARVLVLDELTADLDPGRLSEPTCGVFYADRDQIVMLISHRSAGFELVQGVVEVLRR